MKHYSKQLSWLLAFVLLFTSLVSTGIPVYAAEEPTIIGEGTDIVIPDGEKVKTADNSAILISYYESADSDTILYDDHSPYGSQAIGIDYMLIEPYAWHITFLGKEVNNNTGTDELYHFKAYPDTSLENVPVSTQMTLPEGTTLTTTGAAISVRVDAGTTNLKDYSLASSEYTLPSASQLRSEVGESAFDSALAAAGYHLPDLTTKLFYYVELTDKSTSPYRLKLTLVPPLEVTINTNTGTPDRPVTKMYAMQYNTIDATKLPMVSLNGFDFYGWKRSDSTWYAYLANVTDDNKYDLNSKLSESLELKAMFQELKPTFKLDLANKKVTHLLPDRTYAYQNSSWDYTTILTDAEGIFSYEGLTNFDKYYQLRLNSNKAGVSVDSDSVSLKHNTPNKPVTENTAKTARVTNLDDFAGCEFAIRATSDSGSLGWGNSSTFTGLTPHTEYKIYAKHKADENGFESGEAESVVFITSSVKAVSNDAPNGVTIAEIPVQAHTNSVIEPVLVIKDGDKTLVKDTDYTITYSNNTSVGEATATVTFINDYSGTITKNFNIGYLVSFDGNRGTGTMSDLSVINGQQYTLPTCTFTAPVNKEFKAWNIGGTEFAAGANYTITDNTTITAVWKDLDKVKTPAISPYGGTFSGSQTVTLTSETTDAIIYYTTNGAEPTTGSTVYSTPFTISNSTTVKAIAVKGGMANSDVASASFTKVSSSGGGSSSSSYTYTPPTLTVNFNTDGGSTIESISIKAGSTVGELPAPTKDDFVFEGWYSDKELTKAYDANTKITETTTLHAKWTKVVPKPAENSKNELVLTINSKKANVFGSNKTNVVAPIILKGKPMLPAKFVAESLGAKVTWNDKKQMVTIKGKNKQGKKVTILIYIGKDFAYVNGKKVKLDSPAFMKNGSVYTPVKFIPENLGASVKWNKAKQEIVIKKMKK